MQNCFYLKYLDDCVQLLKSLFFNFYHIRRHCKWRKTEITGLYVQENLLSKVRGIFFQKLANANDCFFLWTNKRNYFTVQQKCHLFVIGTRSKYWLFWRYTFISLRVVSATFLLVCFTCLKESTFETRKNLFHLESSFRSWDNQILTFQIFKFHDIIKCLSMKHETHFIE